jgi:hypothetical protein
VTRKARADRHLWQRWVPIDDKVRVRGHGVETDGALDDRCRDSWKHPRGQLKTISIFARPRRSIDQFRIDEFPTGVVGDLEPRDTVDGKTVDLSGRRIGDEHREPLGFELARVDDLLPPESLAQDVNRQAQVREQAR